MAWTGLLSEIEDSRPPCPRPRVGGAVRGCRRPWNPEARQRELPLSVMHPMDLLDLSYRGEQPIQGVCSHTPRTSPGQRTAAIVIPSRSG
jgi:hypothetical protein